MIKTPHVHNSKSRQNSAISALSYQDQDNHISEKQSKSSRQSSNYYEKKVKQIVDEEAEINHQLRLRAHQQTSNNNNQIAFEQHRQLRHQGSYIKTRKPIIVENSKIKHKLKRHSSLKSPRDHSPHSSSSSLHSASISPVLPAQKDNEKHNNKSEMSKSKQVNSTSRLSPTSPTTNIKINDLRNQIFKLEFELENERKKLNAEKDSKTKVISELKSRFDIEKTAALRAQEARLNAEKLEEFNKYKENAEMDKANEFDLLCKNKDTEVLHLKLKLRDREEKYMKLESIIKEERLKANHSNQKSLELIDKYNNEIKALRGQLSMNETTSPSMINGSISFNKSKHGDDHSTQTTDSYLLKSDVSVQTDHQHLENNSLNSNEQNIIIDKLKKIHQLLASSPYINAQNENIKKLEHSKKENLRLINEIDVFISQLNNQLISIDEERKKLNENLDNVKKDYKQVKDSKLKLEILYKIKCKSDLDKSAMIKKLRLNYDAELMKFRNEENGDLVRHLERQLSLKDLQIMEQSFELENWRSTDNTFNSNVLLGASSVTSSFNQDFSISHHVNSSTNSMSVRSGLVKKIPVDILYTSDPDVVTSTNRRVSDEKDHKVCLLKNKELQEKISKLEKELSSEKKDLKQTSPSQSQDMHSMNDTVNDVSRQTSTVDNVNVKTSEQGGDKERSSQVLEIEKLKAKLNQFSLQLAASTAIAIKQTSYQNTEELDKMLQQSNKEKLLLERELALKNTTNSSSKQQQQQQQNQIKNINRSPDKDNESTISSSTATSRRTSINYYPSHTDIDPLHHSALQDTNDALKAEIQRLAPFEQKCKILEEKSASLNKLKEQKDKLETDVKNYKDKFDQLESELNTTKNKILKQDEMLSSQKKASHNFEEENKLLREKIDEFKNIVNEYSQALENHKNKEIVLEKLNRSLENELKELKVMNTNSELQEQKLHALEQANRILEQELNDVKKDNNSNNDKVNSSAVKKITSLEEMNKQLKEKIQILKQENANLEPLRKELDTLNHKLLSLESNEQINNELKLQIQQLEKVIHEQQEQMNQERLEYEKEINNLKELSKKFTEINSNIVKENQKYKDYFEETELKLELVMKTIKDKETEIHNLQSSKKSEIEAIQSKIDELDKQNFELKNRLSNTNQTATEKDDEIIRLKQKVHEYELKHEKLQNDINSAQTLERELSELQEKYRSIQEKLKEMQQTISQERISNEDKLKKQYQEQQHKIETLTQQLLDESTKNENLNRDNFSLNVELKKLSVIKQKCEHLEIELEKFHQQDTEIKSKSSDECHKLKEHNESLQKKIKSLEDKLVLLQNDILIKDQESEQLQHLIETEKNKTELLLKQLEDVTSINTQLTTQLKDSKIQCTNMETAVYEAIEKQKQAELNAENASFELKKKQEEYKKLQIVHETIKKEHMDTIELLEEKLKDLEKKTELQTLKHEEIMLELESIKAKRDRTLPICPTCSSQTIQLYHSQQQQSYQSRTKITHDVDVQTATPLKASSETPTINELKQQQTIDLTKSRVELPKPKTENKEMNTEPFDLQSLLPKKVMKDEAITANMIEHVKPPVTKFEIYTQTDFPETEQNFSLYICKYSYNPFESSPNDKPELELPLKAGEYLFVFGKKDDDGFYMGELLDGKRGLVPSNFIEKVQHLDKETYQNILSKSILTKFNTTDTNTTNTNVKKIDEKKDLTSTSKNYSIDDKSSLISQNSLEARQNEKTVTNKGHVNQLYPTNIKLEKRQQFNRNIAIVTWDPPVIESSTGDNSNISDEITYQIYLNNDLHSTIKQNQKRSVTIENIDLNVSNRISILAVTQKGSSKPQECTSMIEPINYYSPQNLKVYNLTQNTAIVSWWPASSEYSHDILINNVDNRTLKSGIYRFKLSGLKPDTTHSVLITPIIPSLKKEECSSNAVTLEFHTLPIPVPTNVRVQKASNSSDLYTLSWQPVPNNENQHTVSGYAIYLDSIMVHQIQDPTASMINLNTKLLSKGAKNVTIRSIGSDGGYESKDSEKLLISDHKEETTTINSNNNNNRNLKENISNNPNIVNSKIINKTIENEIGNKNQIEQSIKPITNNLTNTNNNNNNNNNSNNNVPEFKRTNEIEMNKQQQKNLKLDINNMSPSTLDQKQQYIQNNSNNAKINKNINFHNDFDESMTKTTDSSSFEKSYVSPIKMRPDNKIQQSMVEQDTSSEQSYSFQQPRSKSTHKSKQQHDNETDLYLKNTQNTPIQHNKTEYKQPNEPVEVDPRKMKKSPKKTKETDNYNKHYNTLPDQGKHKQHRHAKQKERIFVALFDYDPLTMSPNRETCHEELPFNEGQLIKVYGEQDADGFFFGESMGKSGFIPCNMISELQLDDPYVLQQLLDDINSQSRSYLNSQPDKTFTPINNNYQNNVQYQSSSKKYETNVCQMVALYDYDPQSLSPNADIDTELSFKSGDIITVYGDMDEDGFYLGELNAKRGLVPSNFLKPVERHHHHSHHHQNSSYATKSAEPIKK